MRARVVETNGVIELVLLETPTQNKRKEVTRTNGELYSTGVASV